MRLLNYTEFIRGFLKMWIDAFFSSCCILFVWQKTNCREYPSPQFVLLVGYFFYYYMGVIINYEDPDFRDLAHFEDLVWLTRSGFIIIFFCSLITKDWKTLSVNYYHLRFTQASGSADRWLAKHLYPLAGVAVFISLWYLLIIPVQPILVMFSDSSGLNEAREAVTTGMKNFGFFSNFFNEYIPFIWVLLFLSGKRSAGNFVLVVNLFVLLSTGQKSPILYMLILYVFTEGFLNKRFEYSKTIKYVFISFFVLTLLVYTQNAHLFGGLNWDAVSQSLGGLVRRIFFVGSETVLGYLTTFPDSHPFLIESETSIPADKIVYQTMIGLDIDGTMNSNSLAFFYGWFGNKYLASALYFLVVMLFLATPYIVSLFVLPKLLQIAAFLLFNLLLVKFNITDWYTIYGVFVLACLVLNGLFIITKTCVFSLNETMMHQTTVWSAILSCLMFLYFFQGQVRSFLN